MTLSFVRTLALGALVSVGIAAVGQPYAQAAETVTFRYLANRGGFTPHELAAELGYFDGTGVEVKELGYTGGGPETLFGVASGSIDVANAAVPAVLNAIAGGNDLVAIYPPNGIDDVSKSTFYVLDDSPIKSVADLAGKTIAVNTLGAHLDYVVREALNRAGQPQNAAQLLVVPGPQLEQTLRSKQVDVVAVGHWQATFDGKLVQNGGVRPIFTDTEILGPIAGGFIALKRDFVEAHPEAVRVFAEQSGRAVDWAKAHPQEAKEKLAAVLKRRGENEELAQYWRGFGVPPGAAATNHDIDFWVGVLEREGTLPAGKYKAENILYHRDSGQ